MPTNTGPQPRRAPRRLVLLALLAAIALVAAACGNDDDSQASPSESGAEATLGDDPVTIEYWHINTQALGADTVEALIDEFNATHPGITVEGKFHEGYSNLVQALQAAVVADDPPAVAQIGYSRNRLITDNFPYVPIDELGVELDGYTDQVAALGEIEGRQVAVPYGLSILVMFYNADLFEEAGIDPDDLPTDWDGWIEISEQMRDELDIPLLNFQQFPGDNFISQAMVGSNGGAVLVCDAGTPVAAFGSPEGVVAMELMAQVAQDGMALNVTVDQALQSFLLGETGTLITSIAARANLEDQATFDLRAAPYPSFGDNPRALPSGGNNLFVFSEDPAEQAAAAELIEFLALEESSVDAWVEGTGYLPPLDGAAAEFTSSNAMQQVAADSLPDVVPWVSFPGEGGLEASQIMYDATQAIMLSQQSAADAWPAAADEINSLISGETCDG